MFVYIQTKFDMFDGKLESISNQIDSLSSQRTRKRENIANEYYSKKSSHAIIKSVVDDIPCSSPLTPVNGWAILNMTSETQQLGEIILPVAR